GPVGRRRPPGRAGRRRAAPSRAGPRGPPLRPAPHRLPALTRPGRPPAGDAIRWARHVGVRRPGDVDPDRWRPERPLSIADAVDRMLDGLEVLYRGQAPAGPDLLPVVTGVAELDRVCGGGAHRGWVTAVEADE